MPLVVALAQLPVPVQADPSLSDPMHLSMWRESITGGSTVVHIFGEVANTGTAARHVRVTCQLLTAGNAVLAFETTSTELDIIKQNERSAFDDIFPNPPPPTAVDHYSCTLAGSTGTSSVADHDFTTTITSTAADQSTVTGTVQNNRDVPVDNVRVFLTFYHGGAVVDVDSVSINSGASLASGSPPTSFELDRTSDRPAWDAVTAMTEAPAPSAQLPTAVVFSDQIQGTTSAVNNVVLTNDGTANLHIPASATSIVGSNASDFAIAQDGCSAHTLVPDATCTIGLTFTPGATGPRSAALHVIDDSRATAESVSLGGNGLSRKAATISPASLDFGDQVVNTSSTQTVTVTSVGPDAVTINQVQLGGANAGDYSITSDGCSGQTIAVNGTCAIDVTFTPSALGTRSANLTITDNGRIAHDPVGLTGNGIPLVPVAHATFTPTQLAFGAQVIGTQSTKTTVLKNTGHADLVIASIAVANTSTPAGNDFTESDHCPATLAYLDSCTITVQFAPTTFAARSGSLTVTSNGGGSPVSLTGTGLAARGPSVSSWGRGRLDVFMKGGNGELWHKYYDASVGWQGWSSLGAPPSGVTMTSDPIAISWGYARIDVFVRGSDNALWHKYYDVNLGGWSTWYSHGGALTSGPTATTWGWGRLDVFWRGAGGDLRHIFYAAFIGAWSNEYSHDGGLASDPSAISWGYARIDVVARGTDGTLQHDDYDINAGGWSGWETVGTQTLISRPTITTWGPGRLDVFAQGSDNTLQHNYFYAGRWQGWTSQGTPDSNAMTSDPFAIAWSAGRLDIFARGQNDSLLHKFYDSSVGWSGWFSEGLPPGPR